MDRVDDREDEDVDEDEDDDTDMKSNLWMTFDHRLRTPIKIGQILEICRSANLQIRNRFCKFANKFTNLHENTYRLPPCERCQFFL